MRGRVAQGVAEGWHQGGSAVAPHGDAFRLVPGLLAVKIKHTERRGLLILATLPAAWEQAHLKF